MKNRLFITIQLPSKNEIFDLEVPTGRSIHDILPLILKSISYPPVNPLDRMPFTLWQQDGKKLNTNQSFQQAGISNFQVLLLDSKPPVQELKRETVSKEIETDVVETRSKSEVQVQSTEQESIIEEKATEKATPDESVQVKENVKKRVQDLVAIPKKPGIIKTRKP